MPWENIRMHAYLYVTDMHGPLYHKGNNAVLCCIHSETLLFLKKLLQSENMTILNIAMAAIMPPPFLFSIRLNKNNNDGLL